MSWVKLDDGFTRNRKVAKLSDAAFRFHVSALCWCAEHLTDGRILADELTELSPLSPTRAKRMMKEIVDKGAWDTHPDGGWWQIHDYLVYNTEPHMPDWWSRKPPDVKALKQAMADAHPDRGGSAEQFREARRRYVQATTGGDR